jgi:elongation factor Ts
MNIMAISASMVKELREKTGAGMLDCKKALEETAGDFEQAVDWLRKKGLSAAAKKSDRVAAEGLVAVDVQGNTAVVIEVNAETDFVARNDKFQDFVRNVVTKAHGKEDVETLKAEHYAGNQSIQDYLTHLIATIGENMSLRRVANISVSKGHIISYMHNQIAPGLGKIGVLVALETEADVAKLTTVGEGIAMHIAAMNPAALTSDGIDKAKVDREVKILREKAIAAGRPENIIEKMVESGVKTYLSEAALVEQAYVLDNKKKVIDIVNELSKEVGTSVKLTGFLRFELGEGIEKQATDFAAEVASMSQ